MLRSALCRPSAVLVAVGSLGTGLLVALAPPAQAYSDLCGDTDHVAVSGGRYVVQNNRWNPNGADQCTRPADDGFEVTSGSHNVPLDGPPAAYTASVRPAVASR